MPGPGSTQPDLCSIPTAAEQEERARRLFWRGARLCGGVIWWMP
jgi:hypothetical protein